MTDAGVGANFGDIHSECVKGGAGVGIGSMVGEWYYFCCRILYLSSQYRISYLQSSASASKYPVQSTPIHNSINSGLTQFLRVCRCLYRCLPRIFPRYIDIPQMSFPSSSPRHSPPQPYTYTAPMLTLAFLCAVILYCPATQSNPASTALYRLQIPGNSQVL